MTAVAVLAESDTHGWPILVRLVDLCFQDLPAVTCVADSQIMPAAE